MTDQTPACWVVIYTADDWDGRPLISPPTWAPTAETASHRVVNARQGRSALNTVGPFTDQVEAESYRRTWARAQGQATIAGLLTVTADLIQTNGLHTGSGWFAETAGLSPAQSPLSVYGAMNVAFGAGPDDTRGTRDGLSSADTARALSEHLGTSALEWCQEPGRTQDEVLNALHACASAMLDTADRTKSAALPPPELIGDEEPAGEAADAPDLGVSAYPHTEWIVTVHSDDEEGDPGTRAGSILSTPSVETFMDQLRDAGLTVSVDRSAGEITYASAICPTGYIRLRRPNPGETRTRVTPIRSGADVESEGWTAGDDFEVSFTVETGPTGERPALGRYRLAVLPMSTGTVYGVRDVARNVVLSDAFGQGYGAWSSTRQAAEAVVTTSNEEWSAAGGWGAGLYVDPDSVVTVDAHNGPEKWDGRRWNRYVTNAETNRTMISVRILAID